MLTVSLDEFVENVSQVSRDPPVIVGMSVNVRAWISVYFSTLSNCSGVENESA